MRKREKREGGRSVTESEAEYSGEIEEEVGSEGMEEEVVAVALRKVTF